MADFVILVTGSRTWTDRKVFWDALDQAFAEAAVSMKGDDDWRVVIRHGANPRGADDLAAWWVGIRKMTWGDNIAEDPRPADWLAPCRETCKPGHRRPRPGTSVTECPAAGPYRNADMVGPDVRVTLAFLDECANPRCGRPQPHWSHGGSGCADLAEKAGIRTRRFTAS